MPRRPTPFPALAAAEVIARRMPLMWWAAMTPDARGRAEMVRMAAEKNVAFAEGIAAANFKLVSEATALWGQAMMGGLTTDAISRSASRVAEAATVPAARRVKANRARLRRRKSF